MKRDNDSIDIPAHADVRELWKWQFKSQPVAICPGDDISYGDGENCADWTKVPKEDRARLVVMFDYATYSDYSGSNVERSNYRALLENFRDIGVATAHGGYDTTALILPLAVWRRERCGACDAERCDKCAKVAEFREAIHALEDYPLYDEDDESNLRVEREGEDWDSYACKDFADDVIEAARRGECEPIEPKDWDNGAWFQLFFEAGGETEEDHDGTPLFRTETYDDRIVNRRMRDEHYKAHPGERCPDERQSVVIRAAELLTAHGWTYPKPTPPDYSLVRRLRRKLNRDKRWIAKIHRRYGLKPEGGAKRTPDPALEIPYRAAFRRMAKTQAALDNLSAAYQREV